MQLTHRWRSISAALLACVVNWNLATANEVYNFDISERSCVAHSESSWGYYGQLSQLHDGDRKEILLPNDWGLRYEACGRALAPLHRQSPIELPAPASLAAGKSSAARAS